jgi:hypothetical protein
MHVHSQLSPGSSKKEAESLGSIGQHPPSNANYRLTGKEEERIENRDKYVYDFSSRPGSLAWRAGPG